MWTRAHGHQSSAGSRPRRFAAKQAPQQLLRKTVIPDPRSPRGGKVVEASYSYPFLSHPR